MSSLMNLTFDVSCLLNSASFYFLIIHGYYLEISLLMHQA